MNKKYGNKYSMKYFHKNSNTNRDFLIEIVKIVVPAIVSVAVAILWKKK